MNIRTRRILAAAVIAPAVAFSSLTPALADDGLELPIDPAPIEEVGS